MANEENIFNIQLQKDSRYECLFCLFFNGCRRLIANELIIKIIQQEGKCPDRNPFWINPSCRNSFFCFTTAKYYILGSDELREPNKYYRVPSEEVKKYVEKS